MILFGFSTAIIIGIILGFLGGGGSILSIPILVYLFKIEPHLATTYSLFIVGISSLIGIIPKYIQGHLDIRIAVIFGVPALFTVFITRTFLLSLIPETIVYWGDFELTKSILIMFIFALLMIGASFSMIKTPAEYVELNTSEKLKFTPIIIQGLAVGLTTGLVGAGGGFLIIPSMVFLCKLPIKKAVGTSLLIIAANSSIGFIGDLSLNSANIDWKLLIIFTILTIAGIFIGDYLSKYIDSNKLKKGFGWFVLIMGIYIILKEIFN